MNLAVAIELRNSLEQALLACSIGSAEYDDILVWFWASRRMVANLQDQERNDYEDSGYCW